MNLTKYLEQSGVPSELWDSAILSLTEAKQKSKGLLWHKIKARYFMSRKMAQVVIDNQSTRVGDVKPEWAKFDVARALNINAFGDNADWINGRPIDENVFDFEEGSEEYIKATNRNYWCKGVFPGEFKAIAAWYRRNGGEAEAETRGRAVPNILTSKEVIHYIGPAGSTYRCGNTWQIVVNDKWLGFIPVRVRVGFEIDNLYDFRQHTQMRFALDNEQLMAPVTWSVLPGKH